MILSSSALTVPFGANVAIAYLFGDDRGLSLLP